MVNGKIHYCSHLVGTALSTRLVVCVHAIKHECVDWRYLIVWYCWARPQSSILKQVVSGHWKPSGNSGRQGHTWTLPASSATSADVLVRRGSGYMHIVALTYQPEFTVIQDPSCRRLSPPPPLLNLSPSTEVDLAW